MDDDRMTRRVPNILKHPYAVFLEDGQRLGLVDEPRHIAKLLDADQRAGVLICRRGYVVLSDLDAWLCLPRVFKLRDYMSQSTVVRCRTENGQLYFDLRRRPRPKHGPPGNSDSRRPARRFRRGGSHQQPMTPPHQSRGV